MATINELMEVDVRDVKARLLITYLNPLYQETVTVSSSDTDPLTSEQQIINNVFFPAEHWFSFNDNDLSGKYKFLPDPYDSTIEVGWWSQQASEADGTFISPPSFTLSFAAQDVEAFSLVGDKMVETYPVDFTIEFFNSVGTSLGIETITGNDTASFLKKLVYTSVSEITVTINKINKPNAKARIIEASLLLIEAYDEDDIVSISTLEEINYQQLGVPIGGVSANEITVDLLNVNDKFNVYDPDSPVLDYLKRRRKLELEFGVVDEVTQTIEWVKIGDFFSVDWKISPESISITVRALDRLERLRNSEYKSGQVFINKSLYFLFEEVLNDGGLGAAEYNIDTSLQSHILPYAWFGVKSHRAALLDIAKSNLVNIYVDREGIIQIGRVASTTTNQFEFNNSNSFKKEYPSRLDDDINRLEVKAYNYSLTPQEVIGQFNQTLTISAGSTYKLTLDFESNACTDVQPLTYSKDASITVVSEELYCWGAEITFNNTGSTAANVTQIIAEGKKVQTDGSLFVTAEDLEDQSINGVVKQGYDFKFIQGINYAQTLADELFEIIKLSNLDIVIQNRGHIGLRLGDKVTFYDEKYGVSKEYLLVRQTLDWSGALNGETRGKQL